MNALFAKVEAMLKNTLLTQHDASENEFLVFVNENLSNSRCTSKVDHRIAHTHTHT